MADLTTLAEVKAWLKITASTDDTLLAAMISGASAFIQSWISRTIASTSYTETRNGFGSVAMLTQNYPITAVSSVTVDNVAIPAAADCTKTGYQFDSISIYLRGYKFTHGTQNVIISYTAGYAAVPADLKMCCWELVGKKYRERDRIGQTSKTLGPETVAFAASDLSTETLSLLRNYIKVVPI